MNYSQLYVLTWTTRVYMPDAAVSDSTGFAVRTVPSSPLHRGATDESVGLGATRSAFEPFNVLLGTGVQNYLGPPRFATSCKVREMTAEASSASY